MTDRIEFPNNSMVARSGRIVELKNLELRLWRDTNGGWGSLFDTEYNKRKVVLLNKVKIHTKLMFERKYKTKESYYVEQWKDGWLFFPSKWIKKDK